MSDTTVRDPRNVGHGHVRLRPDGAFALCGGPTLCRECAREWKEVHGHEFRLPNVDAPVIAPAGRPAIWLQTLPSCGSRVGGAFDLVHPTPSMVDFEVLATVSARIPRFAGQTGLGALPLAQHEYEGARAIIRDTGRRDWAAAFLIHDGHEYVMGDMATPVVDAIVAHAMAAAAEAGLDMEAARLLVRAAIRSLKTTIDSAIYQAAGLPWPLPPQTIAVVKLYDMRMGRTERDARLAEPPFVWEDTYAHAVPLAGCDLYPWSEGTTRKLYWRALCEFLPALGGNASAPYGCGND